VFASEAARKRWVTRRDAERRVALDGRLNHCRYVIFDNKLINGYRNHEFIRFAFTLPIASVLPASKSLMGDFGSARGYVGRTVADQLNQQAGRRVVPIGFDNFREDFWQGPREKPLIKTFHRDLRRLNFRAEGFHAGILRFALPFVPKDDQPEALRQIYHVLKPGAVLVVLNDGVFKEAETGRAWTPLITEVASVEGMSGMHYLSCEKLMQLAKEAGFEVTQAEDLTERAMGYLSPRLFAETLEPEAQAAALARLEPVFRTWKEKDRSSFEPAFLDPDSLRVPWRMYRCVLRKPVSPK
jgi:SAM-dependent methyltransferase